MSANEALRRQLDELRLEKQALEVENVRLKEENIDGAKLLAVEKDKEEQARTIENLTEENGNLKNLYEELLWDNQARQQAEPRQEYEREQEARRCSELEEELQREKERAELTCHRAVVEERRKWEERETRWARQLQLVEEQLKAQGSNNETSISGSRASPREFFTSVSSDVSTSASSPDITTANTPILSPLFSVSDTAPSPSFTTVSRTTPPPLASSIPVMLSRPTMDIMPNTVSTGQTLSEPVIDPLHHQQCTPNTLAELPLVTNTSPPVVPNVCVVPSMFGLPNPCSTDLSTRTISQPITINPAPSLVNSGAWMPQQLPPLNKFSGEGDDGVGETIDEWLEQFELVATVAHWDQPAKLANLVTCLKGPAFAFFRSCPADQHSNYPLLVSELKKRFTPVHIRAVQTSLFHERKQADKETVDTFAQDL